MPRSLSQWLAHATAPPSSKIHSSFLFVLLCLLIVVGVPFRVPKAEDQSHHRSIACARPGIAGDRTRAARASDEVVVRKSSHGSDDHRKYSLRQTYDVCAR